MDELQPMVQPCRSRTPNPEMVSSSSAIPLMNSRPNQAEMNSQQNQSFQSQPNSSTGLMHSQPNNMLSHDASMSFSPPLSDPLNWSHARLSQDRHFQSNINAEGSSSYLHISPPLANEPCQEESGSPSQLSQPDRLDQNQIDGQVPSKLKGKQKKELSQTKSAILGRANREKKKKETEELQTEKERATENKRRLTEEIAKLTAEKMVLANENQMLKEEKVAWTTENHNLTVNMAIISENIGKLSAQYETLSQSIICRQQDEQTTAHNGQSDIQMIHQQLKLVTLKVLQIKTDMLAALKQGLLSLDSFRQSDEQIPTQNRQPNITRNHHASTSASESQGCQQASTSCPQPNEPIQEQARQPTIEHIHPSTYSAKQQLAPESFQTTQNDSQISSVVQDPQRTTSVSTEGGIVTSSHLTENQENSLATSMPMAELLNKVDEKGKSKADFSDFPSLDKNDRVKVGRYDVPKSLHSTAQKIMDKYGDVTKESIMHHDVDERTFILSCASMKEMEELPLDHVTEDYILKWSDTTKTALEMRFDVEFMMDELKKGIVPSYSDRVKFQASWDDLQQTYAKRRKLFME